MSAIFDFSSLLTVILLLICTCAYLRDMRPTIFDGGQVSCLRACFALLLWKDGSSAEGSKLKYAIMLKFLRKLYAHIFTHRYAIVQIPKTGERLKRSGVTGFLWKMSRIGERLSPYVGVSCAIMAIHILFFK